MSILEAIRKVQMDEVCRLLRTTNLSGAAIAAQTGFGANLEFSNFAPKFCVEVSHCR
jgi:transcriptional regulator GlxA family with amidase domain